jgi:hypothetical protein
MRTTALGYIKSRRKAAIEEDCGLKEEDWKVEEEKEEKQ